VIVEGLQILQMLRPGTPVTVKAEPFQAGATPPAGAARSGSAPNGTAK